MGLFVKFVIIRVVLGQQKSHRVAPMAKIKKPWGLIGHPWLIIPLWEGPYG